MKNLKKFYGLLLMLVALTVLVSCGGSGEEIPEGSSEYVFEAEYVDTSIIGEVDGWSGGGSNNTVVSVDATGSFEASNGFYANYLYKEGVTLTFVINSDKAVDNATLKLRLSAEGIDYDLIINPSIYTVEVNGTALDYSPAVISDIQGLGSATPRPFSDFVVSSTLSLVEGENTIKLITSNNIKLAGTTTATAPLVDCIKIVTDANLTWTEHTENLDNF